MAKTSSGAGFRSARRGWWSAYGEPLVAKYGTPTSAFSLPGRLLPLAPLVSANCAHLRVWEVGWGNVHLYLAVFWCGSPDLPYLAGRGLLGAFP